MIEIKRSLSRILSLGLVIVLMLTMLPTVAKAASAGNSGAIGTVVHVTKASELKEYLTAPKTYTIVLDKDISFKDNSITNVWCQHGTDQHSHHFRRSDLICAANVLCRRNRRQPILTERTGKKQPPSGIALEGCFSVSGMRGRSAAAGIHGFSSGPEISLSSQTHLTNRAGLPTTTAPAGTSLVTTLPAPTTAPSPMVTPGRTVQLAPIQT